MGALKRYAEEVSVELGYEGEINDHVMKEAEKRLYSDFYKLCGEFRQMGIPFEAEDAPYHFTRPDDIPNPAHTISMGDIEMFFDADGKYYGTFHSDAEHFQKPKERKTLVMEQRIRPVKLVSWNDT